MHEEMLSVPAKERNKLNYIVKETKKTCFYAFFELISKSFF